MESSEKADVKELKNVLLHIDDRETECRMCKFVLIFAFAVLLLVFLFVFIFRFQPTAVIPGQVPLQMTNPLNSSETQQRIIDLKSPQDSSTNTSVQSTISTEANTNK